MDKTKEYQLTDNRSGEAFLLKSGRNRRLSIFDKEKGYRRAIRHCPNEKSIYIDEQSEHALVTPIIFERGFLTVPPDQIMTQQFLSAHPDNVANGGGWFEEIDESAIAKDSVNREELILDIKQIVRDKSKDKDGIFYLEMVSASILGSYVKAKDMTQEEMKRVIYNKIDENPSYFTDDLGNINIFDDEEVQRKYLVLRALSDGVIKKSANNKSITWGDAGKEIIVSAPRGVDLVDFFVNYLSSDEGILVIEEIKRRS